MKIKLVGQMLFIYARERNSLENVENLIHNKGETMTTLMTIGGAVDFKNRSYSRNLSNGQAARSLARSMAGPAVTLTLTPISLPNTCASVVLPRLGGP